MIDLLKITDEQAKRAIEQGEFEESILKTSSNVAIVLTQSWCPQWVFMRSYLKKLTKEERDETKEMTVFTFEYDRVPYFDQFMRFKEGIYKNDLVPYIRYYKDGKLFETTNYVSKPGFLSVFN